jgi:hypothetical protein
MRSILAWVLPASLVAFACSGGDSNGGSGDAGNDTASGDTGSNDGPADSPADVTDSGATGCPPQDHADGAACNMLSPMGNPVTINCQANQMPPSPSGGTIADGTYVLTSSTWYGPCPPAESDRITWLVCGSTWQTVQEGTINDDTSTTHTDAHVTSSGSLLTIDFNCGNTGTVTIGYDASPTMLVLYFAGTGGVTQGRVDTFTRQ